MRVYRAEADPSNILTLEEEHGLLQIAHRPQANAIVLRIGKQLLPRLSPLARLYLCTEYDLDGLLRRAVENERARRTRVKHLLRLNATPTVVSMLSDAFSEIFTDLDVKLPFHDPQWPLSTTWRLHLATARDQLATGRRSSLERYIASCRPDETWSGNDCLQFIHLPQTTQTDAGLHKLWSDKLALGMVCILRD